MPHHPRNTVLVLATAALLALTARPAFAWHDEGHVYIALAAAEALPEDVPAFFRAGRHTIAHTSLDPDAVRDPQLPQARQAEGPEHYLDLELLGEHPLPATRYELIALCHELDRDPRHVGFLPYAITEWAQRLTMAFAEHRRYPDNPHIRQKCLVYAGLLAHYTADLHMPLHTTIHFDGRVEESGRLPHTGIHERIDALPSKLAYVELFEEPVGPVAAQEDVFAFVVEELGRSHALVDRVYEIEPVVPALSEPVIDAEAVRDFTRQRTRAAARFTAAIFLSAWRHSAAIELPGWLDREVFDERFDPETVPPPSR